MPKIIFSDVQGNYNALMKFLTETESMGGKKYICLGDIVANGTSFDENRCISTIREIRCIAVRGNHEEDLLRRVEVDKRVRERFWPENIDYLKNLKIGEKIGDIFLVHASHSGRRIQSIDEGEREFKVLDSDIKICFFGHTHRYTIYEEIKEGKIIDRSDEKVITLAKGRRYLINPGGLGLYYGLPSSYIIFDENERVIRKVEIKK